MDYLPRLEGDSRWWFLLEYRLQIGKDVTCHVVQFNDNFILDLVSLRQLFKKRILLNGGSSFLVDRLDVFHDIFAGVFLGLLLGELSFAQEVESNRYGVPYGIHYELLYLCQHLFIDPAFQEAALLQLFL